MATVVPVLAALSIFTAEICYDRLGCFSNKDPWSGTLQRPLGLLPWAPEKINTRFLLYTKDNVNTYQEVNAINPGTISGSNFRANRKSRFVIHGFTDSGENDWMTDLCQAILQVEDVNCFCIDWSGGSRTLYSQAANNIRVVGAEVAYFIATLQEVFNYSLSNAHIIGHSLGAHTAGEAGKRLPGIGRITGLDPAEPYFQDSPPEIRLDPSDALFVDAIHTDSTPTIAHLGTGGYGMSQTVGHLDFFPNGGKQMPGCMKLQVVSHVNVDDIKSTLDDLVACNHLRSYRYYTESVLSPGGFVGFPSSSYHDFLSGTGFPCSSGGCARMGHDADKYRGVTAETQTFYLNTGDQKNYSRWRYNVSVRTARGFPVLGNFVVSVVGSNAKTQEYPIHWGLIKPDMTYTKFIDFEIDLRSISMATIVWRNTLPAVNHLKLRAVTVQFGEDGAVTSFCTSGIKPERSQQILSLCGPPEPL